MNWYIQAVRRYAVFQGRARRKEYWYFFLFNALITIVLSALDRALGMRGSGVGTLYLIYTLAVLLPNLGVSARRLHDTGRSGWWLLLSLVPLIGSIVLLVFMCQDGTPGENTYGANPKTVGMV